VSSEALAFAAHRHYLGQCSNDNGATMTEEKYGKCDDHDCECGCGDADSCDCENELEIIELEDENGDMEEFVILDELDFEDRHFVIVAPLAEMQAQMGEGDGRDDSDFDMDIAIFECDDDEYTPVEDDDLARRLMAHLDKLEGELDV